MTPQEKLKKQWDKIALNAAYGRVSQPVMFTLNFDWYEEYDVHSKLIRVASNCHDHHSA